MRLSHIIRGITAINPKVLSYDQLDALVIVMIDALKRIRHEAETREANHQGKIALPPIPKIH